MWHCYCLTNCLHTLVLVYSKVPDYTITNTWQGYLVTHRIWNDIGKWVDVNGYSASTTIIQYFIVIS